MSKYTISVGNVPIVLEVSNLAQQANGSIVVRKGDTMLLVTVCASKEPKEGVDFLPLSVEVSERAYGIGQLPGGFFKREGRPTSDAILAARLCDRPLRPLFPKEYHNEIQVVITVLSGDRVNPYSALGIIGASAALMLSSIPFNTPIGACAIGRVNGQLIVNPTYQELQQGDLDLTVAGSEDSIMMVEAGANEVSEEVILEALKLAQDVNTNIIQVIKEIQANHGKPKSQQPTADKDLEELETYVTDYVGESAQNAFLTEGNKDVKNTAVKKLLEETKMHMVENRPSINISLLERVLQKTEKEAARTCIIEHSVRPDGRLLEQIRPLDSEVGILPRVHGSAIFTRGETQILNAVTLAPMSENQRLDGFGIEKERYFIHHYNFPPYSTGETGKFITTGRREIGHGALAERALLPSIPSTEKFPYTIRSVSEALSSNGSTSMASVCSGSLALMDAGVPVSAHVAGIAMGLVTDNSGRYKILTDIQGLEDHIGDMDFKVAGTSKGVTAMQMDIKVTGISFEIMQEALTQARIARFQVLEHMVKTLQRPRENINLHAPKIAKFTIPIDKIGAVIGSGGAVIRSLMDKFEVTIDIDNNGTVIIGSSDQESIQKAQKSIMTLSGKIEIGEKFLGKVTKILPFGAFVEISPGKEGLVHISQLAVERVESVESVVSVGDELEVVVVKVDNTGRLDLSARALLVDTDNSDTNQRNRYDNNAERKNRRPYSRSNGHSRYNNADGKKGNRESQSHNRPRRSVNSKRTHSSPRPPI